MMLSEREEKVVGMLRVKGPSLPIDVSKLLGVETMLASAILSSLISKGYVKISSKKVGASPLYYLSGQESRVRSILYPELSDLEKKALERLKTLKVALKDDLFPQERILLSEMKDFVSYLQIKKDGREFFCWKHYSVNEEEFNDLLNKKLFPKKQEQESQNLNIEDIQQSTAPPKQKVLKVTQPKQKIQEIKLKRKQPSKKPNGEFSNNISNYLESIGAKISEKKISRNELTYIISLPSPAGEQTYIVKAKDKKNLSENDLSKFYVEALSKKMPLLLIVPNSLSKKAKDYSEKNFGNLLKIIVLKK